MTGSGTHNSWAAMKRRCFYTSHEHFGSYGGRGITVCERWLLFENFLADMGERPEGCTLERIDPDGDYTPENCRWASQKEQCRNRRNNRLITCAGLTLTLAEWSARTGLDASKISHRLTAGWSVVNVQVSPVTCPYAARALPRLSMVYATYCFRAGA